MDIFNEMLWSQFVQQNEIRTLPLNEQVNKYNQYLSELSISRQNWLNSQSKGPLRKFLLHEDLEYMLQEDGSKIIVT